MLSTHKFISFHLPPARALECLCLLAPKPDSRPTSQPLKGRPAGLESDFAAQAKPFKAHN